MWKADRLMERPPERLMEQLLERPPERLMERLLAPRPREAETARGSVPIPHPPAKRVP